MRTKILSISVLVLILGLYGCEWFKPSPDVVAEVADEQLTLAELRATVLPSDTLTRTQWTERIGNWVDNEILYREALARGLDKKKRVKELLAIAERKILIDQLRLQLDSTLGDVSDGEMALYYENHSEQFHRDRDVWTVAKVQFPNMKIAESFVNSWSPAQSEGLLAGKPSILPAGATLQIEVAGPGSDTCWYNDVRHFKRKDLSVPRVCAGNVQSFMLVDRLDSGGVLTFMEVRSRLRDMVIEERRAQKLAQMLADAKGRYTIFSYPKALDSLAPNP